MRWWSTDFGVLILMIYSTSFTSSLMFQLQPGGQKCLREEVHKDVLVTGDYEITEVPGQVVDLHVSYKPRTISLSIDDG